MEHRTNHGMNQVVGIPENFEGDASGQLGGDEQSPGSHHHTARTPAWVRDAIEQLESEERLDGVAAAYAGFGHGIAEGPAGPALRGHWLGHALHPVLTDLPLGCWQAVHILDLIGGKRARPAAKRLLGVGLLAAAPTALTGLAELGTIEDPKARRVAVAHAAGNSVAVLLYSASYRRRRRDHHLSAKVLALGGGAVALGAGYLGGHLAFGRKIGTGLRGADELGAEGGVRGAGREGTARTGVDDPAEGAPVVEEIVVEQVHIEDLGEMHRDAEVSGPASSDLLGIHEVAKELTVPEEQVHTMIHDGLLDAAETDPLRFRAADVQALRIQGA